MDIPNGDKPVFSSVHFVGEVRNAFKGTDGIFVDCLFSRMTLEGAFMDMASFVRCRLMDVDFYWAHFFKTRFVGCCFERVRFQGANLTDCSFIDCELVDCDFGKDNLGADTDCSSCRWIHSNIRDCKGLSR